MSASTDATLPRAPPACGTAPPPDAPGHRAVAAAPVDLGRNRPIRVAATHGHRPPAGSGQPAEDTGGSYPGYHAARPMLPGSEISPGCRGSGKPGPSTTGRHGEPGVSWHTGGVRAHCTGPWNRARRQHSAIGALSYDTYARAAALVSRGGDTSRGPACTRA
ncbi:hypothetical protein STPH2_2260 [Streptomyces sp. KO7888]|nr:hypothetical protein [Streptomyces sp. KO7888]